MGKVAAGLFAHSEGLSRRPYVEELLLGGKKSLAWLLEGMRHIVDHVVVISPSEDRLELIEKILAEEGHSEFEGIIDDSALVANMCLKACSVLEGDDILLVLPTFSPLVPTDVMALLVELLEGREGVFLRERTRKLYKYMFSVKVAEGMKAFRQIETEQGDMLEIPDGLKRTMAISWDAMGTMDPLRLTFFRLFSELDLAQAEKLLSKVRTR